MLYGLLERGHDSEVGLDYFVVPPIVRELLGDHGFSPTALQALASAMGRYHRFQGEHVSRRWSDDVEAIYHFRQAGEHVIADAIAEDVCASTTAAAITVAARDLTKTLSSVRRRPLPGGH